MIPYDDLVAALSAWRARQGLPVSTMGAPVAAPATPPSGPYSAPRTAPPGAPPRTPAVFDTGEAEVVDDSLLDDAEAEMSYGDVADDDGDGSTAVGTPPARGGGRRGNDEW